MLRGQRQVISAALARAFPERRLFLRSDTETRFVRLSPATQAIALSGSALVVGWTILASAVVLMDSVASDDLRDNAAREQAVYEQRLNAMSDERDQAFAEARAAQERFNAALDQISDMQSDILASEARREELEQGMEIAHAKLRDAIIDRDAARTQQAQMTAQLKGDPSLVADEALLAEYQSTIDLLAGALDSTASQRDDMAGEAEEAEQFAEEMIIEAQLQEDRNDRIFAQLEDALTISVEPLDKMFRSAGLDTDTLLKSVRNGYSGQGGPMTPISFSTKGEAPDEVSLRANGILERLDEMNLYRLAAAKAPFAIPINGNFRFTSGFGPRWGRMHEGTDFAGAHGTPIQTTADGTVIYAGRASGYGNFVKIKHDFGIVTSYAHMSAIHVKVGQRVSRGDRIGDMGNTGRSTGTHLHYEVRVGGKPINPMTYIKAARNVF
ncbi:DUF5930 domain-containing protein [Palleronia sp.]|uniref:DUF5930 domain-containing protein n=1 Tax=Palleronia sp. TaxID=1940284 RepID=UPI0035C8356A